MKNYCGLRVTDCRFFLALLFSCSFAVGQLTQNLTYQHPDKSFTLQFPAGWSESNPTSPVQSAYFFYTQNQTLMAEAIVFMEPLIQDVHVQFYAASAEQNSLQGLTNYLKLAESMLVIDNRNTVWRKFQYTQTTAQGLQSVVAEEYYFISSNAAYTFHFGTFSHFYASIKPQFDQIIQSLRLFQVGPMPPNPSIQNVLLPTVPPKPIPTPPPQTAVFNAQAIYAGPAPSPTNEVPTSPNEAVTGPAIQPLNLAMTLPLAPYQDPKGRFSILVPTGWTSVETAAGSMSVSGSGHALSVEIMPQAEMVDTMLTVVTNGKEILNQGPCQIREMNGTKTVFKNKGLKGEDVIETFVTVREKGLIISLILPANEYESYTKTVDEILNSVKL